MMPLARSGLIIVSAAALIDRAGQVLVARRAAGPLAGLWEFPGGKIEPGETPAQALARELDEELGIIVDPADCVPAGFASAPLGDRHLLLLLHICRSWQGEPRPIEADALQWLDPAALETLAMPAPDRPLIPMLRALL